MFESESAIISFLHYGIWLSLALSYLMHLKMLDTWICCKLWHISQMKTLPAALLFMAVSLEV